MCTVYPLLIRNHKCTWHYKDIQNGRENLLNRKFRIEIYVFIPLGCGCC